jgi:RNA polymerase sigma factor (sigma-70 family)
MVNLNALLKVAQQDKKILSSEEEITLGTIIQSPTSTEISKRTAIEKLVMSNIRLVLKICHKYKRQEFDFEDLVGYGILGLYTAAQKFDPTFKTRFASYARYWIKDGIMKALREYSGVPKIPVYLVKNLWCVAHILSKNGELTDKDLAASADISEKDAAYSRSLMFKAVQFDASYVKECPETPEDIYASKERDKLIYEILHKVLTIDEFTVLAHTYELCGYTKMTFAQIETELGIKNSSKLKVEALKKLRNSGLMQGLYKEGI